MLGWDYYGQIGDGPLAGDKDVPVDVIVPETCYQLSRAKNGSGALPVAAFAHSPGCPLDHYLPGTQIILQAAPELQPACAELERTRCGRTRR